GQGDPCYGSPCCFSLPRIQTPIPCPPGVEDFKANMRPVHRTPANHGNTKPCRPFSRAGVAQFIVSLAALGLLSLTLGCSDPNTESHPAAERVFAVEGVIKEIKPDGISAVIQHEAI